jgi:hypothetical protein
MIHQNCIHEGVLRDIVSMITDGSVGNLSSIVANKLSHGGNYFKNITKASSKLILTFPLIVDDSVSPSTAAMTSKALEKKLVLMLEMLFSAISITNNKDAFEFVGKVHQNLSANDVEVYINKLKNPYTENSSLLSNIIDQFNENYSCINPGVVLSSELPTELCNEDSKKEIIVFKHKGNNQEESKKERFTAASVRKMVDKAKKAAGESQQKKFGELNNDLANQKIENEKLRKKIDSIAHPSYTISTLDQQLKKANDALPSLMCISFKNSDGKNEAQAIIGVKVKIVYVSQQDMVERIIMKSDEQHSLFEFLKATTGEISMIKDFMFALDKAKLDVFNRSVNSSPIWKLLERRAYINRSNNFTGFNNGAGTSIATFLVSSDTMSILDKEYNFPVNNTRKLLKIMTDYSALGFIIADDVTEKIKILFDDNDYNFEVLSYSALEREDKNQYKKIINLLAGK